MAVSSVSSVGVFLACYSDWIVDLLVVGVDWGGGIILNV